MSTPLTDIVAFVTADTPGFAALGAARYVVVLFFDLLLLASVVLAVLNVVEDPAQRRARHAWLWLVRVCLGGLLFESMLWSLPIGPGNGLHRWLGLMADRAAFPEIGGFARDVLLPGFGWANPLAFLIEFTFAAALVLGLFVRPAALGTTLAALALWLGLYDAKPGDPVAWAWSMPLLAALSFTLAVSSAGRALGADAWIRRHVAAVRDGRASGVPLRLLT